MSELKDALNAWTNLSRKLSGKEHDNDLTAIYSYLVAEQPRPAPVDASILQAQLEAGKAVIDGLPSHVREQSQTYQYRKQSVDAEAVVGAIESANLIDNVLGRCYKEKVAVPYGRLQQYTAALNKHLETIRTRLNTSAGIASDKDTVFMHREAAEDLCKAPPQPAQLGGLLERVPDDYDITFYHNARIGGEWMCVLDDYNYERDLPTGYGKTPTEALTAALREVGDG